MKKPASSSHLFFKIGMWWKGIDGVLQVAGGTVLLFVSNVDLNRWVYRLTQYDDDQDDLMTRVMSSLARNVSHQAQMGGVFYLWAHGGLKIMLVVGLMSGKKWTYPLGLLMQAVFIVYEAFVFFHKGSLLMLALAVSDMVIFYLIYREYHRLREVEKYGRAQHKGR